MRVHFASFFILFFHSLSSLIPFVPVVWLIVMKEARIRFPSLSSFISINHTSFGNKAILWLSEEWTELGLGSGLLVELELMSCVVVCNELNTM